MFKFVVDKQTDGANSICPRSIYAGAREGNENVMEKDENVGNQHFLHFPSFNLIIYPSSFQ